jgi:uncharacterized membrane protein
VEDFSVKACEWYLPPVTPKKPRSREVKRVKNNPKIYTSLTATLAALYAVGVVALAPISFPIFQVRVADALLPLAILLGWPAILAFSLGALISNFFGGLGVVDIIGGTIANFLGTYVAWRIGQMKMKGSWAIAVTVEALVITAIVGSYLSYLFQMPLELSLLGVLLGSIAAIVVLGYTLLQLLSRTNFVNILETHGFVIYRRKRV